MQVKTFKIRLDREYTEQDEIAMNDFLRNVDVSKTIVQLITNQKENYFAILVFFDLRAMKFTYVSGPLRYLPFDYNPNANSYHDFNESQQKRYKSIIKWRDELAKEVNIHPSHILKLSEIFDLVKTNIRKVEDLIYMDGFGEIRKEKYGKQIIDIINSVPG